MTNKVTRKAKAAFSIAAVALMGFGTTAAFAQEVDEQLPVTSVTEDTGSLTVTKLTSPAAPGTTNGAENSNLPEGADPIKGVTFHAAKVTDIDLKTNEGWQQATELFKAMQEAKADLTTFLGDVNNPTKVGNAALDPEVPVQTTNDAGVAKFAELPVGVYLVWETLDSDTVTVKGVEKKKELVTKAAPFLVTVPMTNPADRTAWMYDIFVYPKNNINELDKKVNDNDKGFGDGNSNLDDQHVSVITYTLTAAIPKGVEALKKFEIVDKFDNEKMSWLGEEGAKADPVTGDAVKIVNAAGQDVTLEFGVDYEFDDTHYDDGYVTVNFKEPGLAKLVANGGGKVEWTFHGGVLGAVDPYELKNQVFLNNSEGAWEPDNFVPGPEVKSFYGNVIVTKKDPQGGLLDGAKFELYECDPSANYELGRQVTVDNEKVWTSTGGKIEIKGLLVNDFRNNSFYVNGVNGDKWIEKSAYCLKEIEAPTGYELLPNPISFQLRSWQGEDVAQANPAAPAVVEFDIVNQPTPELPKTGGAGMATLIGAGALLLAGSGAYAYAANRKRKNA